MKLWLFYLLGCFSVGVLLREVDGKVQIGVAIAAACVAALFFVVQGFI